MLLVSATAACGGDEPAAHCTEAVSAGPTAGSGLESLRLEQLGTVIAVRTVPGLATATVVSETRIKDLIGPVRAAILGAGYTILLEENEGFEADFTFNRGSRQHGIARIIDKFDCRVREIQVSVAENVPAASQTATSPGPSATGSPSTSSG